MPEDHPLWSKKTKEGIQAVTLKDLGNYVLRRVDEGGQVINFFNLRNDFNKSVVLSPHCILELKEVFGEVLKTSMKGGQK